MKCVHQRKIVLVFLVLLMFKIDATAQEQKSPFWSHVRLGGGIGLSFGSEFFSGTLAPSAIYDFNDKFSMGLGLSGTYNTSTNKRAYRLTDWVTEQHTVM